MFVVKTELLSLTLIVMNFLAAERKRQKVARALDVEMRKRAMVREARANRLNQAL